MLLPLDALDRRSSRATEETRGGSLSGGLAVVVAEHAAEAVAAGDSPPLLANLAARFNQSIAEALMIALNVIMSFELPKGTTQ